MHKFFYNVRSIVGSRCKIMDACSYHLLLKYLTKWSVFPLREWERTVKALKTGWGKPHRYFSISFFVCCCCFVFLGFKFSTPPPGPRVGLPESLLVTRENSSSIFCKRWNSLSLFYVRVHAHGGVNYEANFIWCFIYRGTIFSWPEIKSLKFTRNAHMKFVGIRLAKSSSHRMRIFSYSLYLTNKEA